MASMAAAKREFKGIWIPKEIWLSRELSAMEKLVFAEIHSLDNDFGCVAGNEHFVQMFDITPRTVQRLIKSLKDKGIIEVTISKSNDTRVLRVLGRFAHLSEESIAEVGFLKAELIRKFTSEARRSND